MKDGGKGERSILKSKKVLGVHLNKKHIVSEFLIGNSNGSEWISKKDAIALAQAGVLYVIVVHAKSGDYLRPKSHQVPFSQMIC